MPSKKEQSKQGKTPSLTLEQLCDRACDIVRSSENLVERDRKCVEAFGLKYEQVRERLRRIPKLSSSLSRAIQEAKEKKAKAFAKSRAPVGPESPADRYRELVRLAKKPGMTIERMCNALAMPPKDVRALLARAMKDGVHIHVEDTTIRFEIRDAGDTLMRTKVAPIKGETCKVAVISDTHFGSLYCMRQEIKDFVLYAYSKGVRHILHPGDVLDGCYRHSQFELLQSGLDLQCDDAFCTLPKLEGLTYHFIEGNHDNTFSDAAGFHAGKYLVDYFRERFRNDLRFYGSRSAHIDMYGARIHLWHPRGSLASYAKSYNLQKKIGSYDPGQKPHVLLTGHYHQFCYVDERGVHGFLCPTFHNGMSSFGHSLVGTCAVGGLLLEWEATKSGTLRNFRVERRSYFPSEPLQRVKASEPLET